MTRSSGANEQTFLARRGVRIGRDLPQIGPTALASVAAARLVQPEDVDAHSSGSPALRKPSITIGRAGIVSTKNLIVS